MNKGYIKIYRDLQEHWIWQEPQKLKWWLDMLMMTNIKDNKMLRGGKLVTIKRGSFHTSEVNLATRWNVSRKVVTNFLKLLQEDGMIEIEKSRNGTTIELLNYKAYQDKNGQNGTANVAEVVTEVVAEVVTAKVAQSKKGKNAKECKETIYSVLKDYAPNGELHEALKAFIEWRTKAKKPLTVRSFKQALDKLNALSGNNQETKVKLVDHATQKGWLTFYEIKENSPTGYKSSAQKMTQGMYQHDWDMDELERKQREHLAEKYKDKV